MKSTKCAQLTVLIAAATIIGEAVIAAPPESSAATNVFGIENSDVVWEGNHFGLNPLLSKRATKCLEHLSRLKQSDGYEAESKKLRALLDDPKCFVMAHVLLTLLSEREFEVTAERWNHLRVVLTKHSAVIDTEQIPQIAAFWRASEHSREKAEPKTPGKRADSPVER